MSFIKEYTNSLGQTLKLGDVIVRATSRSSNVRLDVCVVEEIANHRVSLKRVALNRCHYEWSYLGEVKAEPKYKKSWLTACNFIVIGNVNEPVGSAQVSDFSAIVNQLQTKATMIRKNDDEAERLRLAVLEERKLQESLVPSLDQLRADRAETCVKKIVAKNDEPKLYETYVQKYPPTIYPTNYFHLALVTARKSECLTCRLHDRVF